jgi:hypothetical protein
VVVISGLLPHRLETAMTKRLLRFRVMFALAALAASTAAAAEDTGYPTAARAEYVFACMATNGGTRDALQHCACAIDVIASLLPYDRYVQAEAVIRMRQGPVSGDLAQQFRSAISNDMFRALEEAQAEAEVRCF